MVLRFQRHDQEYKFPFNLQMAGREIPVGLGLTTLVLGLVAIANLFSKQIATKYGVAFTIVFFVMFTISEQMNRRTQARPRRRGWSSSIWITSADIDDQRCTRARAACWWRCAIIHRMEHLKRVLEKTNLRRHDIVVMTVRPISTGAGEYDLSRRQIFSDYEKELFSHVVEVAEKEGKPVELLVVPAVNPFDAHGAGGQHAAGVAPGDRRQRAHGIGRTGAAHRPGVAECCRSRGMRFRSK